MFWVFIIRVSFAFIQPITYWPLSIEVLLQVLRKPWWIRQSPCSYKELTFYWGRQTIKFSDSGKCNKEIKILLLDLAAFSLLPLSCSHVLTFLPVQLRFYAPSLYSYPQLIHPFLLFLYLPGKIPTWLNPNRGHLHTYSWVAENGWRKTIILTGLRWTSWPLFSLSPPCSFLATKLHSLLHASPVFLQE